MSGKLTCKGFWSRLRLDPVSLGLFLTSCVLFGLSFVFYFLSFLTA